MMKRRNNGKKKSSNIDMLHGPIAIKIVMLAIPILLTSVMQQLFNSADMIVAGRFAGSNALAAVGANTFVTNLMVNIFVGLSTGSNVVIARLIGQGNSNGVSKAVHTSIVVAIASGIFLTIVGCMFAEPILRLIDTPESVMKDAAIYFRIIFVGMPFMLLFNFCSAILRAKGDTKRALYVLASFGFINVLLNMFLVVNCQMGVAGVATATLVSTTGSALTMLWLLMHETDNLKVEISKLSVHLPSLKEIARIGLPTGVQGMVFSFSNVIIQGGINSLGADFMAASTASLNFDYFSYFALIAFAQSGMSFLSQNHGAQQMVRCKRIIFTTLALGVCSALIVSYTCVVLRYGLAGFFSTSSTVIEYAAMRMVLVLPFYFIHGINEILSALLRAVGYSLVPATICIVGICGTRLAWLLLYFPTHHTYNVLNSSYPISWIVTTCVMIPTAWFVLNKVLKRSAQRNQEMSSNKILQSSNS